MNVPDFIQLLIVISGGVLSVINFLMLKEIRKSEPTPLYPDYPKTLLPKPIQKGKNIPIVNDDKTILERSQREDPQ